MKYEIFFIRMEATGAVTGGVAYGLHLQIFNYIDFYFLKN